MEDSERKTLKEMKDERHKKTTMDWKWGGIRASQTGTEWKRGRETKIISERVGERRRNHDERRREEKEIIIPLSTYDVRHWLVEWPGGQPSLGAISNRMTDGKNIVQWRPKEFRQGDNVAAPLWPSHGLIFFLTAGQDPKWVGLCYPHMTEVLIYFNEIWSQGDRIHVLILGSHMTVVLVCCNEPGSQGNHTCSVWVPKWHKC